jgi:hypothetical protein
MANERNRNQTFQWDFSPELIAWIPTGVKFNSGYNHTRTGQTAARSNPKDITPEHFDAKSNHDIRFNSGLKLAAIFADLEKVSKPVKWLHKGISSTQKGMDKLKLRNIDANYSINHRYNSEEFTFEALNDQENVYKNPVAPFDFYCYQLGMVYDPRVLYNYSAFKNQVILGKPNPYFMDYLSEPMLINNPNNMNHSIDRNADVQSGFTVPVIDLSLSGTLRWSESFALYRDYTLMASNDTTISWPNYSVNGRFADFSKKFAFLKKRFRSFVTSSSYGYDKKSTFNLFNRKLESTSISHKFNPLMKISATSKGNIRYENSFNYSFSMGNDFYKEATGDSGIIPSYLGPQKMPTYQRNGERTRKETTSMSDVFTVSYDIQTRKGVQFWRWYVKLENNLRLKFTTEAGWDRETNTSVRINRMPEENRVRDELRLKVRPEVSYNFTRKMDAMLYAQYIREQRFHTTKDDVIHEIEIHSEFTMRF